MVKIFQTADQFLEALKDQACDPWKVRLDSAQRDLELGVPLHEVMQKLWVIAVRTGNLNSLMQAIIATEGEEKAEELLLWMLSALRHEPVTIEFISPKWVDGQWLVSSMAFYKLINSARMHSDEAVRGVATILANPSSERWYDIDAMDNDLMWLIAKACPLTFLGVSE